MINYILDFFKNLPNELTVFMMSMAPLIELRGGIVAGYLYNFPLYKTLLLTITANMLPIPFILLFIKHIFKFFYQHNILVKTIEKVTNRAMAKSDKVKSLEFWGLMLFVAIPLPTTGAWTGALLASLLNIKFNKAISAIYIGIIIAAIIMSLTVYGVIDFLVVA